MTATPLPLIHRWINITPDKPVLLQTSRATLAAFTQPRAGKSENEDAIAVVEFSSNHHLLLLADGVGGMPGGAQASALAMDGLIASICEARRQEQPVQQGVLNGFDEANRAICQSDGSGATTLMVVDIDDGLLRTYHAGDSGVLVTGQRGRVKLVTMAHSPVGYAQEAGYLTEAEAIHHEERHVVSNLLGSADMRIEIGQLLPLSRFDTVVVGSDGLFDNLLSDEIAEAVRRGPLGKAAQSLAQRAALRMIEPQPGLPSKPDDLSFVLYRRRGRALAADSGL